MRNCVILLIGIQAKKNLQNHKVSFERASEIFLDTLAISIFDNEHSTDEEDRWITIGKDSHEAMLVIVHTFEEIAPDEANIRIISAWKATKSEIKQYEEYER
jgi:hypothetical protein